MIDAATGETFHNEFARYPLRSASIIKVPILCAVLAAHHGDPAALSSKERADADLMIRRSDNDATSRFWRALGGPRVIAYLQRAAGTRDARIAPENPQWWGYTHVTAADMAAVLYGVASRRLLPMPACDYVLSEMRQVIPEQRWGIPDGCPTPAAVAVKNGWYPEENEGKVWRVHSTGVAPAGGAPDRAVIAILTRYPLERGMAYGQETCRLVASEILRAF